jgi:hypothetical protein
MKFAARQGKTMELLAKWANSRQLLHYLRSVFSLTDLTNLVVKKTIS